MEKEASLHITAGLGDLETIRRFVEGRLAEFEVDPDTNYDFLLAVTEAATNIVVHGYRGQPGPIEITVRQDDRSLVVVLRDQATLFDPLQLPSPDLMQPLEKRPLGGMGVFLMQEVMDQVIYRITPEGGNELILVKEDIINE